MNLGEIRQVLGSRDIRLTKSLGQNFLHDRHNLERIVEAAGLAPGDNVLEIGPGLGALTQLLLLKQTQLLAIEKDKRLFDFLAESSPASSRFTLVHADALEYLQEKPVDWAAWNVVSNLPYSVGSPILVELAKSSGPPKKMIVTVQEEVARRIAAAPADKNYGVLSLLLQLQYEAKILFTIPGSCFFPPPDVQSACVRLDRRPWLLAEAPQRAAFEKIVKRGFSQRRKMMMKLLRADWPEEVLGRAFAELGLSVQVRAETLTLQQFVDLTKLLAVPEPSK